MESIKVLQQKLLAVASWRLLFKCLFAPVNTCCHYNRWNFNDNTKNVLTLYTKRLPWDCTNPLTPILSLILYFYCSLADTIIFLLSASAIHHSETYWLAKETVFGSQTFTSIYITLCFANCYHFGLFVSLSFISGCFMWNDLHSYWLVYDLFLVSQYTLVISVYEYSTH